MRALILAAGVGHRLAPLTDRRPKCLLPVGGRSLLERMLASLAAVSVSEAVIVVGHCQDQIRQVAGDRFGPLVVRYVENPEYTRDSIRSLWACRTELDEDFILMDADVLFPTGILRRLVECPDTSALLIDRGFTDTGEEVKVYTRARQVVALGKKVKPPPHDAVGEGVGFFKCAGAHGPVLRECMAEVLRDSTRYHEYEDALDLLLRRIHVGWVDVGGLPWTEIDFAEDLRRAEAELLPQIERLRDEP
ncbi:MAG: phosphocholine cytidylyltransferase family protein [Candidatus Rokubacteria bacterium]|nr:phosphocholine cytidylyltransferase family protein [Candidatus Rokubacteria bacterium]